MSSRTIAVAGMVLALALGLAACGSSGGGGGGGGGKTVDIYSSLPLQGASKDNTAALVNGIKLALSQAANKAGTIPAWEGGLSQAPPDWKGPGNHLTDPFPNDQPLFTITA